MPYPRDPMASYAEVLYIIIVLGVAGAVGLGGGLIGFCIVIAIGAAIRLGIMLA